MSQFLLPDLGEGLEEAQLVQWLVRVGDTVTLNQPLCQVETAKALVDIPSPFTGTVATLHAHPGDTVPVGAVLVTITDSATTPAHNGASGASAATTPAADGHGPVLVGYGTEGPAQTFTRRRRGSAVQTAGMTPVRLAAVAPTAIVAPPAPTAPPLPTTPASPVPAGPLRASPLVRKMAAQRGVDLSTIAGSGPRGRIRVVDFERATRAASSAQPIATIQTAPDEERISTVGLRKAIAARMMKAATTIPHFTEYSLFDAYAVTALRERLKSDPAYAEHRLTFLPFFVRALVAAVRAYPVMNSRWDEEGNAIVVKHSIHVGIATDTPRGLLVPVIHDAHTLGLIEIAAESNRLVQLARDGKIGAQSLTGGTITLTNVGAAGPVDTGAPLINPPEACVVGFGAIKPRPTAVGEQILIRPSCWISISCDHRIVDGATAAQFMGALVHHLEQPEALL